MRIAFIFYDAPGYVAGPLVNARRLLPELVRRGHAVHALVFHRGEYAPSVPHMEAAGVQCHVAPFSLPSEPLVRGILREVSDIAPDVFVPNLSVQGWMAGRWVREAGIPTIGAHRSDDGFHHAMIERFVLGSPNWALSGVVCVNEALRESVARRDPPQTKLCTIPSGVPLPTRVSEMRGPLRLVYAGRFVQRAKRVRETLAALCAAVRTVPGASAALLGSGEEREFLEHTIRQEGLDDRVQVKGPIPNEAIQAELANYHAIVLLSDYEGTPGAVMDGMACGLIPVCLDIPGGVRELVRDGETGLLVSDRGSSFVTAIGRLADDAALRNRLSRNARTLIEKSFSLDVAATRWERFFHVLCGESGPKRRVRLPRILRLPPVHPDLAREDVRRESLARRVVGRLRQAAWRVKGALIPA